MSSVFVLDRFILGSEERTQAAATSLPAAATSQPKLQLSSAVFATEGEEEEVGHSGVI